MKVGLKASLFNWEMRRRRKELGWSQGRLAEESGVNVTTIGVIERLENVRLQPELINDKLRHIAFALDMDFWELFPEDYLERLTSGSLCKRSYLWACDVSLDQLPLDAEAMAPDPALLYEKVEMAETVHELLATLTPREASILKLRFGIARGGKRTLEEVASKYRLTQQRIRQIERGALKKLRHPARAKKLREFAPAWVREEEDDTTE